MCQDQTGDVVRVAPSSKKRKAIVRRDQLTWRHTTERRLLLCHGRSRKPLVTVEPDSKYTGMYRIQFPEGGLSDMVNLTRAKAAAVAFALQALNCEAQESSAMAIPGGLQNVPTSLVPDFLQRPPARIRRDGGELFVRHGMEHD